jgi:hypothetical protein
MPRAELARQLEDLVLALSSRCQQSVTLLPSLLLRATVKEGGKIAIATVYPLQNVEHESVPSCLEEGLRRSSLAATESPR